MTPERTTYELIFRRCYETRFISHLDILRALSRAVRRAGLPIYFTEGFNPKPKLSYLSAPLAVGHTSECERLRIQLVDDISPADVEQRFFEQLPPGIAPVSLNLLPVALDGSLPALTAQFLDYYVFIRKDDSTENADMPALLSFSDKPEFADFKIRELAAEEIAAADMFIAAPPDGLTMSDFVGRYFSASYSVRFPAGANYRRPEKLLDQLAVPGIIKMFFHRKREV
ncbi:MAG: TIGR03936 family radical SAM-associated protein [bacterium]